MSAEANITVEGLLAMPLKARQGRTLQDTRAKLTAAMDQRKLLRACLRHHLSILDETQSECDRIQSELDGLNKKHLAERTDLQAAKANLEARVHETGEDLADRERQIAALTSELSKLRTRADKLSATVNALKKGTVRRSAASRTPVCADPVLL